MEWLAWSGVVMPRLLRVPKGPEPVWHSWHCMVTVGRERSFEVVEPWGLWHVVQPSISPAWWAKTNGPRLSTWHFMQGCSLECDLLSIFEDWPMPAVGVEPPWGLWQSEQDMRPSLTRCLEGRSNWERTSVWH